ncbi:MAG: LOG family protein [Epsilonproteobacteria bacterium]|nr:LOG family protein [Campylobacterota bacterium]
MKFATVFGAGGEVKGYKEGVELGRFLAKKGYVVKCGGYGGFMEAVSKGVKEAKGEVIGVIFLNTKGNPYLSKEIFVKDIFERLKLLIQDSELFVVLEGRLGTLTELFLVWALEEKYDPKGRKIALIGESYKDLKGALKELNRLEIFKSVDEFKRAFR